MADYTRHFSKKLSNAFLHSFNNKSSSKTSIYDDVFTVNKKQKQNNRASSAPEVDYSEIFSSSQTSSIPVLDLPQNDVVFSATEFNKNIIKKEVDYTNIFGGIENDDDDLLSVGLQYEELVKNSKMTNKNVRRSPVETGSRLEASDVSNFEEEKRVSSCDEATHDLSDGKKQFNMSFNRSNTGGKDGMNGTMHIAQLPEVAGVSRVIDGTSVPLKKNEDSKPHLPKDVNPTWNSTKEMKEEKNSRKVVSGLSEHGAFVNSTRDSSMEMKEEKHFRKVVSGLSEHGANGFSVNPTQDSTKEIKEQKHFRKVKSGISEYGVNGHSSENDVNFQNVHGWDGSFTNDTLYNANETGLKAHRFKTKPPSGLEHNLGNGNAASERVMHSMSKASRSETSESISSDCTPTFSDEEVDRNSAAATSAAAVTKAIEEAQAKIRIAKELMQRKMEAPQVFVKQGKKDRFKVKTRKEVKMEHEAIRTGVKKSREVDKRESAGGQNTARMETQRVTRVDQVTSSSKRENAGVQNAARTETQYVTRIDQATSSSKGRVEPVPKEAAREVNVNEAWSGTNVEEPAKTIVKESLMEENVKDTARIETRIEQETSSSKGWEEHIPKEAAGEVNVSEALSGANTKEPAKTMVKESLMEKNVKETVMGSNAKESAGKTNTKEAKTKRNLNEVAAVANTKEAATETNVNEIEAETNVKEVAVRTVKFWANYAYQALTKTNVKEAAAETNMKEVAGERYVKEAAIYREVKEAATGSNVKEDEDIAETNVRKAAVGSNVREEMVESNAGEALVEINVKEAAIRTTAREAMVEINVKEAAIETTDREAMVEANVKEAAIRTTAREAMVESNVKEAAIRTPAREAMVEANVKEAAIRTPAREAMVESNVKEAAIETTVREPMVEANVKEAVTETSAIETVTETTVREPAIEADVKKSAETVSVEETSKETSLEETAEETSLDECAIRTNVKESAERTSLEEVCSETSVKESAEEASLEEAAIETNVKESAEETSLEEAATKTNVKESAEETSLEEAAIKTNVKEFAEEIHLEEAVIETNVKESAEEIETNVKEEETSLEEAAIKTDVEESAEETTVEEAGFETNVKESGEETRMKEAAIETSLKEFAEETSVEETPLNQKDEEVRQIDTGMEYSEFVESCKYGETTLVTEQENSKMKPSISNKHERKRWQIPNEAFELPKLDVTDEKVGEETIEQEESKKMGQPVGKHARKKWNIPKKTLEHTEFNVNNLKSAHGPFKLEEFGKQLNAVGVQTWEVHPDHVESAEIHELEKKGKSVRDAGKQEMGAKQHATLEQEIIHEKGAQESWCQPGIEEELTKALDGEENDKRPGKLNEMEEDESTLEKHCTEVNESRKIKWSIHYKEIEEGEGVDCEEKRKVIQDTIRDKERIYQSTYDMPKQDEGENLRRTDEAGKHKYNNTGMVFLEEVYTEEGEWRRLEATKTYSKLEDHRRGTESVESANEDAFEKCKTESDLDDESETLLFEDDEANVVEETENDLKAFEMENELLERGMFVTAYTAKDGLECDDTESYTEDELETPLVDEFQVNLEEADVNGEPGYLDQNKKEAAQAKSTSQSIGQSEETQIHDDPLTTEEKEKEPTQKDMLVEKEHLKNIDELKDKEREREKDRRAVERAIREARERAFAEARERAAMEKAKAEAKQRSEKNNEIKSAAEKASAEAKRRAERAAVERATAEARERALEKALSKKDLPHQSSGPSTSRHSNSSNRGKPSTEKTDDKPTSESALRCKDRLEKHQRIVERAAKALEEKNMRDLLVQKEQAERNRLAEGLDADIKRWSSGKTGNLRALLSTLQYILGPNSTWQPISHTEIVTTDAVRKAYRKATLFVHPDKLQQRGASIQQKYICEKVFDLLKEAWNRFNSEER